MQQIEVEKFKIMKGLKAEIDFVTQRIEAICEEQKRSKHLDIKVQADLLRYSETRLNLVKTVQVWGDIFG